jgi:hypothetical protein
MIDLEKLKFFGGQFYAVLPNKGHNSESLKAFGPGLQSSRKHPSPKLSGGAKA